MRSCVGALSADEPAARRFARGGRVAASLRDLQLRAALRLAGRKSRSSKSTTRPSRLRAPIGVNSMRVVVARFAALAAEDREARGAGAERLRRRRRACAGPPASRARRARNRLPGSALRRCVRTQPPGIERPPAAAFPAFAAPARNRRPHAAARAVAEREADLLRRGGARRFRARRSAGFRSRSAQGARSARNCAMAWAMRRGSAPRRPSRRS